MKKFFFLLLKCKQLSSIYDIIKSVWKIDNLDPYY